MQAPTPHNPVPESRWQAVIAREKLRLSNGRAPVLMALLGALSGLVAGGIVIAFRLLYETAQTGLLPGGGEAFESLAPWQRLALAVAGATLIGLYLQRMGAAARHTGIAYVIERTAYHQALLPVRNAVHQFVAGALAIISGQSVGREGPSVHLGATAGSQLGQRLGLPHNSLRVLVACGTAAAIGASFNTPLAGVAFAMEVVVMEYTIAGFLPVIIAAVVATATAHMVVGADIAFTIPALSIQGLHELPLVLVLGLVAGGLAAAFIRSLRLANGLLPGWSVTARAALGGAVVGTIALAVPQVMGIGYDTVAAALGGQIEPGMLILIIAAKLVATAAVLGLGIPGGLIGPTLVMGTAAGAALGLLFAALVPVAIGSPALYALLGMGAMMGATLRAPLAALTAMLELTANPGIILPGMLAIAAGMLAARELFRTDSIYHLSLGERGLDPRRNPLLQAASRLGILDLVDRRFAVLSATAGAAEVAATLDAEPHWLIVEGVAGNGPRLASAEALAGRPASVTAVRALSRPLACIDERASLREALERMRDGGDDALAVQARTPSGQPRWRGILTRTAIQRAYLA